MNLVIRTMPPTWGAATASRIRMREDRPIFWPEKVWADKRIVIKPSPPTWISRSKTIWPNRDQWVYVSKRTRPVTQAAETAVKNESVTGVTIPSLEETGSIRRTVPIKITVRYPARSIRVGERLMDLRSSFRSSFRSNFQNLCLSSSGGIALIGQQVQHQGRTLI